MLLQPNSHQSWKYDNVVWQLKVRQDDSEDSNKQVIKIFLAAYQQLGSQVLAHGVRSVIVQRATWSQIPPPARIGIRVK